MDKINLNNIEDILIKICKHYSLGKYVSYEIVIQGYEDFNCVVTTEEKPYFIKILNQRRTDEDCSNYIERMKKATEIDINYPKLYQVD